MAQENAKKFMELLSRDEELQKKMKAATEAFTGDKSDEKAVFDAVFAPIAKEAGCEFTLEDMKELAKASDDDELSEDEAAAAAGGLWYDPHTWFGDGDGEPWICAHTFI